MSVNAIDRGRLRLMDKKLNRLARESAALYHAAVKAQMPLETLSAAARLSMDVAAIHNRVFALRYPMEDVS